MEAKNDVTFEHLGAARLYNLTIRLDVKIMMAVIPAGEIRRLTEHQPASIFNISDVVKCTDAPPVGEAWITRSGRAVMFNIDGVRYISPLAQIKGMLKGERKYANISTIREMQPLTSTEPRAGVTS